MYPVQLELCDVYYESIPFDKAIKEAYMNEVITENVVEATASWLPWNTQFPPTPGWGLACRQCMLRCHSVLVMARTNLPMVGGL